MILKNKAQMTGRELCDLEGYVFPVLASFGEDQETQKKAFLELIQTHGAEIVTLCYTKNDGSKLEEVAEAYRFQLMTDMPALLAFVVNMGGEDEGKQETTPTPRKIRR